MVQSSTGVVPQITSQLATSLESKSNHKHITPKQNDITAMQRQKLRSNPKKKFGHCNGRSSCAHSIGKFFLCYMVLFSSETSAPGSPGNYLYIYLHLASMYGECRQIYIYQSHGSYMGNGKRVQIPRPDEDCLKNRVPKSLDFPFGPKTGCLT